MVEYLEAHQEYDWCLCDFDIFYTRKGFLRNNANQIYDRADMDRLTVEDFVLFRYFRAVWRFSFRSTCLKELEIADHIPEGQRITHEAYILLPLFISGATGGHITKALYIYRDEIGGITDASGFSAKKAYEEAYLGAIRYVLSWLDMCEDLRNRINTVAEAQYHLELMYYCFAFSTGTQDRENAITGMVRCISENIMSDAKRSNKKILKELLYEGGVSYNSLRETVEYALLSDADNEQKQVFENNGGRIIACGAMGKVAQARVPQLIGTSFQPSVLWDMRAEESDELSGIPVTKPDFDTLSETDSVFIFSKNTAVVSEIRGTIAEKQLKSRVYSYKDIDRFRLADLLL